MISSFQLINFYFLRMFNYTVIFGVDGISLIFILLTTFIFSLCAISIIKIFNKFYIKTIIVNIIYLEFLLLSVFSTLDLIIFYIFFESVIVPMFFLIMFGGINKRKIMALLYFFLYTFFGSIFILYAVIFIYILNGSGSFFFIDFLELTFLQKNII